MAEQFCYGSLDCCLTPPSLCVVRIGRHGELEDGPARGVGARPQSPAVRFDDRAANREPQPQTALLGRVEGLKDVLESLRRQSGTESRTATSTPPGSALTVLINNWRALSLVSLMAWTALMIKFRITCCSCTRSASMSGKPSARCISTETPFFVASSRVSSMTSRIAPLISKRSFRGGAFFTR